MRGGELKGSMGNRGIHERTRNMVSCPPSRRPEKTIRISDGYDPVFGDVSKMFPKKILDKGIIL
jgi:hypothetical protein